MDQTFGLLNSEQSDNKDATDELMNDSDTGFIAPEEIELTGNPDNASVLTSGANVHVVDERTTRTKELETNKKRKKSGENIAIKWKRNVSPNS